MEPSWFSSQPIFSLHVRYGLVTLLRGKGQGRERGGGRKEPTRVVFQAADDVYSCACRIESGFLNDKSSDERGEERVRRVPYPA